jgi:methylenetetrahydrofolate reductase (NADPH)
LKEIGASSRLLIIAGDPEVPMGPFDSALSIIESGALQKYGVQEVGIAGYPEGHPLIDDEILWGSLEAKIQAIRAGGMLAEINTQFSFDVEAVIAWVERVRARGITETIRIGVPGPAGIKRLLAFASRFGIGSNAMILKKYGLSLTNLMGTAGPTKFIDQLQKSVDAKNSLGNLGIHFYTFGGVLATAEWINSNIR